MRFLNRCHYFSRKEWRLQNRYQISEERENQISEIVAELSDVAVLFGPVDPPTGSVDGKIAEGTINVDADFVTALRNGELYVNVHTVANPSGEIRGQIGAIDR